MFTVRLVVFGTILSPSHENFSEAVDHCKRAGFEAAIESDRLGTIAAWSPIGGLRMLQSVTRDGKSLAPPTIQIAMPMRD